MSSVLFQVKFNRFKVIFKEDSLSLKFAPVKAFYIKFRLISGQKSNLFCPGLSSWIKQTRAFLAKKYSKNAAYKTGGIVRTLKITSECVLQGFLPLRQMHECFPKASVSPGF